MSRATIHASEKKIADIFSDAYLFSIPQYQRPYAWTTEEVDELLDDLTTALDAGKPSERPPYFLGSVVLIKDPDFPQAEVVDGQQRLTTLTILLSVLRDLVDKKSADQVHKFICQEGNTYLDTTDQFRLTPRFRDAEFFETTIQTSNATANLPVSATENLTGSQQRFVENAVFLHKKLAARDATAQNNLTTFVIQRCYLVVVEVSDKRSAYRVFSVMNDRGLDLSPTDILKADIIGSLPDKERNKYTEIWEDWEDQLGRDGFRDLFGHIRMIHRKQKMRGTLEAEIDEYVKPIEDPKGFLDKTLSPSATAYLSIINQDFTSPSHEKTINCHLKSLGRLDNADWEAPAIFFVTRHEQQPHEIGRFVVDLERLAYGLFIWRANINERITRYGKLIQAIEDGANLYDDESPLQLDGQEQREVLERLAGRLYLATRVRLPVLLRLDEALSDGSASYDHRIITVEHVLPQNPAQGSQWLKRFPVDEEREDWVHRVGNLALLSRAKNSRAGNFDFDRKKSEYFIRRGTSPFSLTSQILACDTWDKAVLEERQKKLMGRFATIWRLAV